jgi:hypothetical protein
MASRATSDVHDQAKRPEGGSKQSTSKELVPLDVITLVKEKRELIFFLQNIDS